MDYQEQEDFKPRRTSRIGSNRFLADGLGKLPPQATELEGAVLGALMLEKDALTSVIDILKPDSFYKDAHKEIFNAIKALFSESEPIDMMTVVSKLRSSGRLEAAGGPHYVAALTERVNSAANIESHARIISEQAIRRALLQVASEIEKDGYDDTVDVFQFMDRVQQLIFDVSESYIRKNYADMRTLAKQFLDDLEAKKDQKDGLTGVPSGFSALDRVTSGFQKSDLVIIAARPGMGKCLGKGTKVLLYNGLLKNVEDIEVGELLMGDDSTPRKVRSIARGRENMYWIHQNKGISYRVNESHILSLKRSRNEGKHKKGDILNITVKDYLQKSDKFKSNYKGYKVAVEFPEKEVSIHPYFLGLWLGDGHSFSSRITNQDTEVIQYLQEYVEELDLNLVAYHQENKTSNYAITKGSRGGQNFYAIQSELRKINVLENKHIPQVYLNNSTENRLLLLAGLIDSDGHYLVQSNGYEITQKNEQLVQQIKFLCDSLGFRTTLKKKKALITSIGYESEVFRLRIYGDVDKIPVRVECKKAQPWQSKIDWKVTGIQVEFDKEDDYYGFEIDGNRLFLLEDMTVTHNTAFVVSAMRNAAVDFSAGVAIFSLEMSSLQLMQRLVSAEAELDSEKLKKAQLAEHEWVQLNYAIRRLENAPIFIDDTPALSILELRAKCRKLKSQYDIQLVIIDYLQLMSADTGGKNKGGNREQEIATISKSLKGIAKELNVPVIALSQLSRAVETRGGDKRPQLSDLRESGSIEQDADMVMFLYRPEYYGITADESGNSTTGLGEVIIAKHRNGSLDTVQLRFIGKYTKFSDLDGGDLVPLKGVMPSGLSSFESESGTIVKTLGSKINQQPDLDDPPF
jgi:replicative DNA helicase